MENPAMQVVLLDYLQILPKGSPLFLNEFLSVQEDGIPLLGILVILAGLEPEHVVRNGHGSVLDLVMTAGRAQSEN